MKYPEFVIYEGKGCPYCMQPTSRSGCCGESSAHFESLYGIDLPGYDSCYYTESEIEETLQSIEAKALLNSENSK